MTFCRILLMMITAEKNVIPDQDTETKLLTNYSAAVKVKTRASTVTLHMETLLIFGLLPRWLF